MPTRFRQNDRRRRQIETHICRHRRRHSRAGASAAASRRIFFTIHPVQLGSLRVGPDLADVGARLPDANWQLLHLYAPQSVVKNSAMPPFRFLFEVRKDRRRAFAGRFEFAEGICARRRL